MKIVLDIETERISKEKWLYLHGIDADTETIVNSADGDQLEKDYQKAGLNAAYSNIICIGMLILTDSLAPVEAIVLYGENEKEILFKFWEKISSIKPQMIITHNGLGFDMPFIKRRSIVQQIKPTMEISLAKFRIEPIYDIMAIWANWEPRAFIKLSLLAKVLDVESKSGDGSQVSEMWTSGKQKEVAEYCLQDVYVTYACYCRMTFHEPLSSPEVLKKKLLYNVDLQNK